MRSFDAQRRRVGKLMTETCVITRPAGRYAKGTMNETTGEVTPPEPEVIYEGNIYVSPTGVQADITPVAGLDASKKEYYGGIEYSAPTLRPGDEVEITASENPRLLGNHYEITSIDEGSISIWQLCKMKRLETSRG